MNGFKAFLEEHNLLDCCPSRLYNCDESGFPLTARTGKVLAPKGLRSVNKVSSGNKQQITTLACYNAAGEVIPPYHVFPGERFKQNPLQDGVPNSYFGRSENGWMTTPLFYGWLANHFIKRIPAERPVVLLVDGHGSHIDLEVSKLARENKILLYCLPPHCTHCLQPCDVGFFKPLKTNWDKAVEQWEVEHLGEVLSKYEFAKVFRVAWENTVRVATLVNSFKAAGLCPLNRSAIKDDILAPATVYRNLETELNGEGQEGEDNNGGEEGDQDKESDESGGKDKGGSEGEESGDNTTGGEGNCSDDKGGSVSGDSEGNGEGSVNEGMSLEELEKTMTPGDIERYNTRLEEGFDISSDSLYVQWKALKVQRPVVLASGSKTTSSPSKSTPLPNASTPPQRVQTPNRISPLFQQVLSYPEVRPKKGKQRVNKHRIPSHLTSDQFIQMCEEKTRKKQEEEDEKSRKKLEREEKAKQRKKELEEKAKLRQQKQEERARKKLEEEKKKEARKLERERKRQSRPGKKRTLSPNSGATSTTPSASDQPSSHEEPGPSQPREPGAEGENTLRAKRRKVTASVPCCALCGTPEDSSDAEKYWVQCSNCERWYEESCAHVSISDIEDEDWFCDICTNI